MFEYFSEAIVLRKEPVNEADYSVSLFTKSFGKVVAKAKSAQKITSKLAAHLEPGNLIQARLIEKNSLQIIEALKIASLPIMIADLDKLDLILAENQPDENIWLILNKGNIDWREAIRILGWDPAAANCHNCGQKNIRFFNIDDQIFLCQKCSLNFNPSNWLKFVDFQPPL
ncbi:MAG: recombination protein O N-terminal domain-containing protein [Patescibacteria group bacterium]|nr:recombination protein O N-terminal domain-containing protein [Patescibacteria group bacterium]